MREVTDNLDDIVSELLHNFCLTLNPDQLDAWQKTRIYKVMGLAMLGLLKLLQCCSADYEPLMKSTISIVNTASIIMKVVTLDVFCTWAEVSFSSNYHTIS